MSRSRRHPVKAFVGYQRSPSKAFVEKHLLWQDISAMKDAREAMASIEKQFTKAINALEGPVTVEAIRYALQPAYDMSQVFCPIDTGVLKESGYLEVAETPRGPEGEVGYAKGNEPPYAIWVHERLDLHHVFPTRAKWLQAAMEQTIGSMMSRLFSYFKQAGVAG